MWLIFKIKMVGKDTKLSKDEETDEIMLFIIMNIHIIVNSDSRPRFKRYNVFARQWTLIL